MTEPIDKFGSKKAGNTTDAAARDHQENQRLQDQSHQAGQKADVVLQTFANYQKKIPDGAPKAPDTKSPTSHADHPEAGSKPTVANAKPEGSSPSHTVATQVGKTESGKVAPKAGDAGSKAIPPNPKNVSANAANANAVIKNAASTFVLNAKGQAPALNDLLFKPKHEVQQAKKSDGPPPHIDSQNKGVVPTASPEGAKMAFTPSKGDTQNNDKNDGKEATSGDKKPKRSERGGIASAKGGAQSTGEATGDQALEASSGGVAGDGDGPSWIAESGVEGFNAESPGDIALINGLRRQTWLQKFVVKSSDKGSAIMATAADPVRSDADPALEEILSRGLTFPTDVNGGRRG